MAKTGSSQQGPGVAGKDWERTSEDWERTGQDQEQLAETGSGQRVNRAGQQGS